MTQYPPVIGACMPVEELPNFKDWLFDRDRDLELQSFTRAEVLTGDWQPLVEEAKKQLDGFKGRLGIHGPFWGIPIDSMDPDVRTVVSTRMLQGLEVCEALDATHMVIHSPYNAWMYNNFPALPTWIANADERVHDTLAPAVKRAEEIGTTIVLENIEDKDPHARVNLAASFGSDAVAVSVDTGHAELSRHMCGAPPPDHFIRAAGSRLAHVHIQDIDGYGDRHWQIGTGCIAWHGVFEALSTIDANPRLVLELKDYTKIMPSMAFLEREGLGQ